MIILLLLSGAALLVAGAELLVRGASRIAQAAGISPLVIGLTVVAFGTSAPELAVSLGATLGGEPGIAVGNVVGSNIFNVLFILGVSALIAPLLVQQQVVRLEVPIMLAVSVALLVLALDGDVSRVDGALLFAGLLGYLFYLFRQSRGNGADAPQADQAPSSEGAAAPGTPSGSFVTAGVVAIVGLALLVLGSRWFVQGAVDLARMLGVSEIVIGLTIIAAGTSLPEVATSVLASVRGERDIAVGNVVGSNIFNILGILGLCGLVGGPVPVAASFISFDMPIMVGVALLALPILFTGMRISRAEGFLFLGYYVAYTAFLVMKATEHDALDTFGSAMLFVVLPATVLGLLLTIARSRPRTG